MQHIATVAGPIRLDVVIKALEGARPGVRPLDEGEGGVSQLPRGPEAHLKHAPTSVKHIWQGHATTRRRACTHADVAHADVDERADTTKITQLLTCTLLMATWKRSWNSLAKEERKSCTTSYCYTTPHLDPLLLLCNTPPDHIPIVHTHTRARTHTHTRARAHTHKPTHTYIYHPPDT